MENVEMNKKVKEKKSEILSLRNSKNIWPTVKPFVNGGLAALITLSGIQTFNTCQVYTVKKMFTPGRISPQWFHNQFAMSQQLPVVMFRGGIHMTTLLGSYELLTRKVEALNKGSPLTFYQVAGCGLISGVFQSIICYPLKQGRVGTAISQAATHRHNCFRHIVSTFSQVVKNEGVLALWKGASPFIPTAIATGAGMLISYDRCRMYLKERSCLWERLGAGYLSGLCAGACGFSIFYAAEVISLVRSRRVECPGSFLHYALHLLKPGGGAKFLSQLGRHSVASAHSIMLIWVCLEAIRDVEESIGL